MPKRRKKTNPVTNRNWLLFRVAGSITVLEPKHFEGESKEAQELAVNIRKKLIQLQALLKCPE
jgi:hypothetical protein